MVSAGEVIRANDVAVQGCRLTRTSALSCAEGAFVTVPFNDELFDTDSMHSTVTNNTRITIQTAGIYMIGFNGAFGAPGGGGADYHRIGCNINLNGSTDIGRFQSPGVSGSSIQQFLGVVTMYNLEVGDYLEVVVRHVAVSGTAARDLELTPDRSPQFWAARIGS